MLEERLSKAYGQHSLGGYGLPAQRQQASPYPSLQANAPSHSGPAENFYTGEPQQDYGRVARQQAYAPQSQPTPQPQFATYDKRGSISSPSPAQYPPQQPQRTESWGSSAPPPQYQQQGYGPSDAGSHAGPGAAQQGRQATQTPGDPGRAAVAADPATSYYFNQAQGQGQQAPSTRWPPRIRIFRSQFSTSLAFLRRQRRHRHSCRNLSRASNRRHRHHPSSSSRRPHTGRIRGRSISPFRRRHNQLLLSNPSSGRKPEYGIRRLRARDVPLGATTRPGAARDRGELDRPVMPGLAAACLTDCSWASKEAGDCIVVHRTVVSARLRHRRIAIWREHQRRGLVGLCMYLRRMVEADEARLYHESKLPQGVLRP